MKQREGLPVSQGLYDPQQEHDACGVGMVIHIHEDKSHEIVENGLQVLEHMAHRGAEGAGSKTGDGAGMMVQIPHEFILLQGIPVPEKGKYGTGLVFLPRQERLREACEAVFNEVLEELGLTLMHWRDVPTDSSILGKGARETEPVVRQIFVTFPRDTADLDRRLYVARKYIENEIARRFPEEPKCAYIVSLSTRTITYKGMLSSQQLRHYFQDLTAPYFTSAIALVHSRFSTNTFPTWDLAQPFRLIGHNGEINTIRGNRAWMETRESLLHPEGLGDMSRLSPVVQPNMSDSASLDNVLEFLVMCGMSLPHALSMLIPESWNRRNPISPALRAFYEYHSIWMEPWDGPVTLLFTDGRYAGGMLDRNGLRPARYLVTEDDIMIIASETGVVDVDPSRIREKGRLCPGKLLIVDTQEGKIYQDEEIKESLAREYPYQDWLEKNRVILENVKSGRKVAHSVEDFGRKLRAFGYHKEDVEKIITPMAATAGEPLSAMGNDAPLAVLSRRPQNLFSYFRQQFAQVTNPPIDPLLEEIVMSATSYIGAIGGNILDPRADFCKVLKIFSPVLTNTEIDILRHLGYKGFRSRTLDMVYP
ncbi:MAG: glutamate synthase subunit alpha, partial [Rikenellaceae bacterium]|nr:glutamate synthase subunit alpha [Rikenellaceae bacterium]